MSLAQYPLIAQRRLHLGDGPSSTANCLGQPTHEAQPAPNWQQYFSRSSNELISRYTHASPWTPSTSIWPENTALSADFRSVDAGPRLSVSSLSKHGHYPESSQRTSLPSYSSSQPLLSNLPLPTLPERRHTPASTPKLKELWGSDLYTIEDTEPSGLPSRNDTCTPPVKQEPDDGFIMEFTNSSSSPSVLEHSLAPPTEVPLRATQASKEMRKMMGVFRLNPFTMHNAGGRGAHAPSWNGEDAGPLSEEPQLYEFQLILDDNEPASEELLRSFSPEFDIVDGSVEGTDSVPRNEWPGYHARELSPSPSRRLPSLWDNSSPQINPSPTGTSASLDLEYPDHDQDQGVSFQHRYLNSYATQHDISASTSYASSSSSSEMTQMSHRDPAPEHTWNDYLRSSRPGSSVGVSVPVHSMTSGPSPTHYLQTGSALSLSATRRWPLPSNSQAPFLL